MILSARYNRFDRKNQSEAFRCALWILSLAAVAPTLGAATYIPMSDGQLSRRASVIVHGVVWSAQVVQDARGDPYTVTTIRPLEVVKGHLEGDLVLRHLGGMLADGRGLVVSGSPKYRVGREVIVFAEPRKDGDYRTLELALGKFEVWRDSVDQRFALPAVPMASLPSPAVSRQAGEREAGDGDFRELRRFLRFLRGGGARGYTADGAPRGKLEPVTHFQKAGTAAPQWYPLLPLRRWNNGASAEWGLVGTVRIDGGGIAQAQAAMATWNDDPNSEIAYTSRIEEGEPPEGSDVMYLDAASSPSWDSCLEGSAGVIGATADHVVEGTVEGTHQWRGETYRTVLSTKIWIRRLCENNPLSAAAIQWAMTHELGHSLGLGHAAERIPGGVGWCIPSWARDRCRGDELEAIMRSTGSHPFQTTLGSDDRDAIRWFYGDGGNHCGASLTAVRPLSPCIIEGP